MRPSLGLPGKTADAVRLQIELYQRHIGSLNSQSRALSAPLSVGNRPAGFTPNLELAPTSDNPGIMSTRPYCRFVEVAPAALAVSRGTRKQHPTAG